MTNRSRTRTRTGTVARWLLGTITLAVVAIAGAMVIADVLTARFDADPNQPPAQQEAMTESTPVRAVVVRVIDGDTVEIQPDDFPSASSQVVRILGIDAPEMNTRTPKGPECGAREAAEHLALLLPPGTRVDVVPDARSDPADRYGRVLAYLTADHLDAGLAMVTDGFAAAWYPHGEPEPERYDSYRDAHQAASAIPRGSWRTCDTLGR